MGYIIKRAKELDIHGMNATKAQKLMYCCYGMLLATLDYRISNETPEAWQFGPVFPRTLRAMKEIGFEGYTKKYALNLGSDLSDEVKSIIDDTLNYFGKYTASQLSIWSHLPNSPWALASDQGKVLYEQMDDQAIKDYFNERVLTKQ